MILIIERMKRTAVMDDRDDTTFGPLSRRCGGLGRDVYVVVSSVFDWKHSIPSGCRIRNTGYELQPHFSGAMVNVEKSRPAGQNLLSENAGGPQATAGSCVNPSPTGMTHMPLYFLALYDDVGLAVLGNLNIADVVHIGMAGTLKGDASPQRVVESHQLMIESSVSLTRSLNPLPILRATITAELCIAMQQVIVLWPGLTKL